jgi:hypothetical protein
MNTSSFHRKICVFDGAGHIAGELTTFTSLALRTRAGLSPRGQGDPDGKQDAEHNDRKAQDDARRLEAWRTGKRIALMSIGIRSETAALRKSFAEAKVIEAKATVHVNHPVVNSDGAVRRREDMDARI